MHSMKPYILGLHALPIDDPMQSTSAAPTRNTDHMCATLQRKLTQSTTHHCLHHAKLPLGSTTSTNNLSCTMTQFRLTITPRITHKTQNETLRKHAAITTQTSNHTTDSHACTPTPTQQVRNRHFVFIKNADTSHCTKLEPGSTAITSSRPGLNKAGPQ